MKIKAIIVDEVPGKCEDCTFGHRPTTCDDDPCELTWNSAVNSNLCPLITESDYLKIEK